MKEHPLICDAREVRAILDGTLSLIVRPVRPQPHCLKDVAAIRAALRGQIVFGKPQWCSQGDRIWVRETWAPFDAWVDGYDREDPVVIRYRADKEIIRWEEGNVVRWRDDGFADPKWRPSIHMPRWASRITLKVVKVRIQRLHSITNKEAIAEGVDVDQCDIDGVDYIDGFAELWDSVYRKRFPWESNPWVWVVGVRRASA